MTTTTTTTSSTSSITAAVDLGDLIPLLCAVAELSGDRSLIDPRFTPRLPTELITIPVDGGVPTETAREARGRVAAALETLFARGLVRPEAPQIPPSELVDFLSAGADDHTEMLLHELGVTGPSAGWSKTSLSPDRPFSVGIIGAGPSGLAMAHALQQHGVPFEIFDANEEVGGTWWSNRYPGCRLDTGRLSYSFSYAQRRDWRHHFTTQPDLARYYRELADEDGLDDVLHLGTTVTSAVFSEGEHLWRLETRSAEGERRHFEFDALVSAVGILNIPRTPSFEGLEDFQGQLVHSAQWPAGLDVDEKRVAMIGTGASAYQIGPAIAADVASLTVFQRSAPWMLPTPTYHEEIPDSTQWLLDNIPNYHRWLRLWEFWVSTIGRYALTVADLEWSRPQSVSASNQRFRDALIAAAQPQYTRRPELLEAVIPTYPVGAKRMLRDNGVWAEMLHRPNVELVTAGIERFTSEGIMSLDGEHHRADLVILATGFDAVHYLGTIDVRGRGGARLRDVWGDEPRAVNGITIPGFPNLFCLSGPNTGLVAIGSQTFMAESAVTYISECLRLLLEQDAHTIEPTPEAYHSYAAWVDAGNRRMAWGAADVTSWYRNSRGTVTASWPYPLLDYWKITRRPDLQAIVLDGDREQGPTLEARHAR